VTRDVAAGNRIEQGHCGWANRRFRSGAQWFLAIPDPKARPLLEPVAAPKVTWADSTRAAAGRLEDQAVTLLKWALVFFLISVVAGILGFTGLSAASADIARFLFYVFVVIFLVLLILGLTIFRV
jgi:uncharacterized membrane protein YtjA (UPF0391 family)